MKNWLLIAVIVSVALNGVVVCGVGNPRRTDGEGGGVPANAEEGESLFLHLMRSKRESTEPLLAGRSGIGEGNKDSGKVKDQKQEQQQQEEGTNNNINNKPAVPEGGGAKAVDNSTTIAGESKSTDTSASDPPRDNKFVLQAKNPDEGVDASILKNTQEPKDSDEIERENQNVENDLGNPTKFDEKAVQRALLVTLGLAVIVIIYFGVKFAMQKKKKMDKRYGRIESEMDLLDEIEVDSEEEEDDTLFDVNTIRRSHL